MTEEIRLTTEVLNCDYFNRNRGFNCYKGKNCTEVPDCYYRQLKRLEQENKDFEILAKSLYKRIEELEKESEALAFRERLYKADYEASEQENKELKIYIESNKQQVEEAEMLVMDNDRLQQEIENLKDVIYYDVEKYRSVLEEIRKLVRADCKGCTAECDCDDNCTRFKIKNKINEVLG